MAIGPRLDLRQSQSLVMTPQLQQAIRLLALSNLELEAVIAEEVDKNPLLEMGEDSVETAAPVPEAGPVEADQMMNGGTGDGAEALDIEPSNENLHQDSAADSNLGLDGGLSM
ncbi:MAG: polymerase sigma-54 factor, partial [Pseudomonadota bacterium]